MDTYEFKSTSQKFEGPVSESNREAESDGTKATSLSDVHTTGQTEQLAYQKPLS